jgi:YD repeat-containing protein
VDALGPDWPVTGTPESLPGTVTTNVTLTAYDALGRMTGTKGQRTGIILDGRPLGPPNTGVHPPCKPDRRGARKSPRILGGRKVSETAPAPAVGSARPVTRDGYDAVGNRTSVTDPLGNVTTYAYDARDRHTKVTDARGFATVTTFDRAGNQTRQTDRRLPRPARSPPGACLRSVACLTDTRSQGCRNAGSPACGKLIECPGKRLFEVACATPPPLPPARRGGWPRRSPAREIDFAVKRD